MSDYAGSSNHTATVAARMMILAFDTCFNACSVAVGIERNGTVECLAECFEPMVTGQAERLIPMIGEVLGQAGVTIAGVGLIGVTTGPGTFTGTRIGVAAAKGLALGHGIPIAALSSLQLLARETALNAKRARDICVAIDVRRDELYVQLFNCNGLTALTAPELMTVKQVQQIMRSQDVLMTGSGATLLSDRAPSSHDHGVMMTQALPRARYALHVLSGHKQGAGSAISPLYLRAPDAKPSSVAPLQRQ